MPSITKPLQSGTRKKEKFSDLLASLIFDSELGLDEEEVGLVVKLNWKMYVSVPFLFTSVCKSNLYHSVLGRACLLPIKEVAIPLLRSGYCKKLPMGSSIKAKCAGPSHLPVTSL